jgi:hypothetical protein
MAKLCPTCQQKPQPPGTYRGQCNAQASPNCKAWTEDFVITLCDPCAEELGRCAWCWGPLDGGRGVEVPTTKQFVRAFVRDSGKHFSGMEVGEQVLIELQIDLYSGYTWRLNRRESSPEVSFYGYRIIRDPQDWRNAALEIYIDLNGANEQAKIVLEEVADSGRSWWWGPPPASNNKPWQCTVEIRR